MNWKIDNGSNIKVKNAGAKRNRRIIRKYCTKCQRETEFYHYERTKGRRGTGPDNRCRECSLRYSREKIRHNKENWVKWKGGACVHCGFTGESCLFDLHHVDPSTKDFGLYTKITVSHSAKIEAELMRITLLSLPSQNRKRAH